MPELKEREYMNALNYANLKMAKKILSEVMFYSDEEVETRLIVEARANINTVFAKVEESVIADGSDQVKEPTND